MPQKSRSTRPSDVVMDELGGEQMPWDLDKHLSGCLAGYQFDPNYGAAVYFALEALWGIANDVALRAKQANLSRINGTRTGSFLQKRACLCLGSGFAR
jgi:hypothetical protein